MGGHLGALGAKERLGFGNTGKETGKFVLIDARVSPESTFPFPGLAWVPAHALSPMEPSSCFTLPCFLSPWLMLAAVADAVPIISIVFLSLTTLLLGPAEQRALGLPCTMPKIQKQGGKSSANVPTSPVPEGASAGR